MPWKCVLLDIVGTQEVEYDPPINGSTIGETCLVDASGNILDFDSLAVGSMFYAPKGAEKGWPWYWAKPDNLADYYKEKNAARQPLFVLLPGRHLFMVDGKCWGPQGAYGGWQVVGMPPNITVSPSINLVGSYHGWLRDGIISDDCEGRQFHPDGRIKRPPVKMTA